MRNQRSCLFLLIYASSLAWGCAQGQPDPTKRLDNLLDSSAYFFPRPKPQEGDTYGAAFVRDPSVISGHEMPAIQGAQAYGWRMLEGAEAARECAKDHDSRIATACQEYLSKFCDRAESAFELSQRETDWWRLNYAKFHNEPGAVRPLKAPPRSIAQTRLVACGIDEIRVVHEADVAKKRRIAKRVAPTNTIAIATAPRAPAKGVVSPVGTAPPLRQAQNAKRKASPPTTKKEATSRGIAAPQTAQAKAAAPRVPVPNAEPGASRNAVTEGSNLAALSRDSNPVRLQAQPPPRESMQTPAEMHSVVTGTFAGQLYGYSGGHIFSSPVTLKLVGAGREVRGTWTSEQGKSGKVTGRLAEPNIASLHLQQINPCAGTYEVSAEIGTDGSRLHGSYTGTDCKGQVAASFIVVRH